MNPFDGNFALNYVLPLAQAAYNEPWNSANNPILATFTQVQELLVDDTGPALLSRAQTLNEDTSLLQEMLRPAGSGTPATVADAIHAETGLPVIPRPAPYAITPTTPIDKRFGWVCRDNQRLIVTFRGTQTTGDWLHDFNFIPAPYLPIPNKATVHAGFQTVYYAVRDNLIQLVNASSSGITELLVTGHSLGAAVALLAMPDLLNNLQTTHGLKVSPILYNFAGPRPGYPDFKDLFNATVDLCWRVVNVWDIVPRVPPPLAGYIHVGNELDIDSGFSFDVARNHHLDTGYLPGLTQWVQQHQPTAAQPKQIGPAPAILAGISD